MIDIPFFLFVVFAVVAIGGGIGMVSSRNPVASLLFLVVTFFSLAGIYVLLNAQFIAAVQVIVYAGAIMVLFLFVIMLLNLQHVQEANTRPVQKFLGYTSAAAFLITILYYILKYAAFTAPASPFRADAHQIGVSLFEAYVFPFEMVSILLLAAIVGAMLLSSRSVDTSESTSTEVMERPDGESGAEVTR